MPPPSYLAARLAALPAHPSTLKWCEWPRPGHQVQIDVKPITPIGAAPAGQDTATIPAGGRRKKHYQFAAIYICQSTSDRLAGGRPAC